MRTLGIDLAAQPANTSACAIEWGTGRPIVSELRSGLDDDHLIDAIEDADKVAIDAPFGWPDEFVDAVAAHRNRAGWPGSGEDQDLYRFQLSFRATDRRLIERGARRPAERLDRPDRRGRDALRLPARPPRRAAVSRSTAPAPAR